MAAAWRQRGGSAAADSWSAPRQREHCPPTHRGGGWWCVCVWWSQPLWLSSPHSLPPTPNHFLTFTRPNTHATRLPPPLHPISCRHGHHRAVSNKGWACWPTTWVTTGWRQRGGSVAAARRQTAGRLRGGTNTAHQHTGVVVCVWWSQPLWLSSPHSLPPTPNHFLTFTRPNTHATHLPPPLHPISCRHGHHRAVSNKGWACWPTTWWRDSRRQGGGSVAAAWRQRGGRQLFGSEAVRTLPTNTQGWWWCVCVCGGGLSLCGSPHHTHSRQLPTISSHSRARIRTPHACHHRRIPFHADMATTGQCLTRAGHAGRPHGGGSVAAEWRQRGGSVAAARRQTAGRLRGSTNTAQQHTGVVVCVCVWWSQPLWLSSPHSLPPTPNHFLTFTRPNTHATHLPPPLHPISCRHGHHRAVSNKGWACWPTTWWRQRGGRVAAARRQRGGSAAADSWSAPRRHEHCPPTHRWWWCVCVVVSASVALLTTLTPANSQPFPHIHAPEYARHTPATTVASHFMPTWPPQGSV